MMPNPTFSDLGRKYNLQRASHDPDLEARIRRGKEGAQTVGSVAALIGENPLEVAGAALEFAPHPLAKLAGLGLMGLGYTSETEAGMVGGAAKRMAKYLGRDQVPQRGTYITKEPGGNWMSGSIESAISPLHRGPAHRDEALALGGVWTNFKDTPEGAAQIARNAAMSNWLDKKLTTYIKNEMSTAKDPVRALAEAWPEKQAAALAAKDAQIRKATADRDAYMLREGITDPGITTRSNAAIRALEAERQQIADRSPLHMEFGEQADWLPSLVEERRLSRGYPAEGLTKTEQGKRWENVSDAEISYRRAGDLLNRADRVAADPWLAKVPPDTQVFSVSPSGISREMGFGHLADELRNALDPSSGLPESLTLTPERLGKLGVADAVSHVADINAWRTGQARLARLANLEKMKANLSLTPRKEYEGGWRWVELPDADDAAGNKLIQDIGCQGGWCTQSEAGARAYGSHGGGNQLYALIDAEGRPHIQTLAAPREFSSKFSNLWDEAMRHVSDDSEGWARFGDSDPYEVLKERIGSHTDEPIEAIKYILSYFPEAEKVIPTYDNLAPAVHQIKPLGNEWDTKLVKERLAVNPRYREELMPMIQDFVKSGQWSDVADLENAGLVDLIARGVPDTLRGGKRFATEAEYLDLVKKGAKGFAGGGIVKRMGKYFSPDQVPARLQGTQIIKEPGGNWLTGSVERAIDPLKRPVVLADRPPAFPDLPAPGVEAALVTRNARNNALNKWLDTKLTKYIKNEMATPDDPVRALAEKGVLHYDPQGGISGGTIANAALNRGRTGYDAAGIGESRLAKGWETLSDTALRKSRALDLSAAERDITFGGKRIDPNTTVYEMNPFASGAGISDLGFPHLVDELRNTINPSSGLPANLLWKYSDLEKVTVPQAVQRVSDINAWRAVQKAEADLALSMNPAIHVFREYPEQGLKWVELKQPDPPEGWAQRKDALGVDKVVADDGYSTVAGTLNDPRRKALADALTYEGNTMQHCVGGYCEDVLSGKKRIFSLRDKQGEPHVTLDVRPARDYIKVDPKPENAYEIYQVKGKANKAPVAKYLPAVQDFVKSQKWDVVGDLQNTGLMRHNLSPELVERMRAAGETVTDYMTEDELATLLSKDYAEGGLVEANPDLAKEFMRRLKLSGAVSSFKDGGLVQYDPVAVASMADDLRGMIYG